LKYRGLQFFFGHVIIASVGCLKTYEVLKRSIAHSFGQKASDF